MWTFDELMLYEPTGNLFADDAFHRAAVAFVRDDRNDYGERFAVWARVVMRRQWRTV